MKTPERFPWWHSLDHDLHLSCSMKAYVVTQHEHAYRHQPETANPEAKKRVEFSVYSIQTCSIATESLHALLLSKRYLHRIPTVLMWELNLGVQMEKGNKERLTHPKPEPSQLTEDNFIFKNNLSQ